VSQLYSKIPKLLPRIVAGPGPLTERDAAWDLATVCYLNARWVSDILGAPEPDIAGA
jgi:hypothetical protein